jgi:hypothetical protein
VLRDGKVKPDKARGSSIDRFLLLFHILSGSEPDRKIREWLEVGFKSRDELVHPKPSHSLDVPQLGRWVKEFSALVFAETALAVAWKNAKHVKARPVLVQS